MKLKAVFIYGAIGLLLSSCAKSNNSEQPQTEVFSIQLMKDLKDVCEYNYDSHFFGSIVYVSQNNGGQVADLSFERCVIGKTNATNKYLKLVLFVVGHEPNLISIAKNGNTITKRAEPHWD